MNMKTLNPFLCALLSIAAVTPAIAHAPRPPIIFSHHVAPTFTQKQLFALLALRTRAARQSTLLLSRNRSFLPLRGRPLIGKSSSSLSVFQSTRVERILAIESETKVLSPAERAIENIIPKNEVLAVKEEEVLQAENRINHIAELPPLSSEKVLEKDLALTVKNEHHVVELPPIRAEKVLEKDLALTTAKNEEKIVALELPTLKPQLIQTQLIPIQIKQTSSIVAIELKNPSVEAIRQEEQRRIDVLKKILEKLQPTGPQPFPRSVEQISADFVRDVIRPQQLRDLAIQRSLLVKLEQGPRQLGIIDLFLDIHRR